MPEMKTKKMILCKQRHPISGVSEAIYPQMIDFTDLDGIDRVADMTVCWLKMDGFALDLYVTGVQYPLVSVINACHRRDVKLTLYHHNPNDDSWYSQEVL